MQLLKPSHEIKSVLTYHLSDDEFARNPEDSLLLLEEAGRTCYKSEEFMHRDSSKKFVKMILENGHESVLEHSALCVKFICDRGVTHELVRHRLIAFSQESTRYCNYAKKGITFVIPLWCTRIKPGVYVSPHPNPEWNEFDANWFRAMYDAETHYNYLSVLGWSPQQARTILPNSLKTEIVCTANFREWRHIFKLRTSPKAHPQMRELMIPFLTECKKLIPVVFDDIKVEV